MRRRSSDPLIGDAGSDSAGDSPFVSPEFFQQVPLACFCTDTAGRIIEWNEAASKLYGRTASEVLERFIWDLLVDAEQRDGLRRMVQQVLGGQKLDGVEGDGIRANGSRFRYLNYAFPLYNAEKNISGAAFAQAYLPERRSTIQSGEDNYRNIFENAFEGIYQLGPDNRFLKVNPALARIFGYADSADFLAAIPIFTRELFVEVDRHEEFLRQLREHGEVDEFEAEVRQKDGTVIWISQNARAVRGDSGKLAHYEGSVENITKRKVAEQRLLRHAFHDKLTGLPDRALFMDRLDQFIRRTKRNEDYMFAVLFLDLDRFKTVNDSLGHMTGDQLLVSTARKLEACLRPGDTVARLGGDEFAILLDDIKDIKEATALAERIQNRLIIPFSLNGQEVFSTASVGIALGTKQTDNMEELLHNADVAMYRAKSEGRARYEVFDTAMYDRAKKLLQLEAELHRAVERNEFKVEYQPIVSLSMGSIVGFEALVRWQHPKRGMVSPGEFVHIAEETGLIVPLGRWVFQEAVGQLARWQRTGRGSTLNLMMSINLSVRQFAQPDLLKFIENTIKEAGVEPSNIKLEITESVIMSNPDSALAMLRQVRDLKVKLSLDDFGTGYSSLSYLHRYPFNVLKIDRSFVSAMELADKNEEIVRTIVNLAHNLNMEVIAEGVETQLQVEHLSALGCHYGQGYYFSGAMDSASASMLLRANPQW